MPESLSKSGMWKTKPRAGSNLWSPIIWLLMLGLTPAHWPMHCIQCMVTVWCMLHMVHRAVQHACCMQHTGLLKDMPFRQGLGLFSGMGCMQHLYWTGPTVWIWGWSGLGLQIGLACWMQQALHVNSTYSRQCALHTSYQEPAHAARGTQGWPAEWPCTPPRWVW